MTPEYLYELADLVDPDKLWRLRGLDQMDLPPEKRRQLDAGIALRRHASDVKRLRNLLGTGKSLLITPLGQSVTDIRSVPTPDEIMQRNGLQASNDKVQRPSVSEVALEPPVGQDGDGT